MGLILARYVPGDEVGLNDLYDTITGRRRDAAKYAWEWLDLPDGPAEIWTAKEEQSGELVGHTGYLPLNVCYFGSPILLGKTENCMMLPRYRGTGAYFPLEQRVTEEKLGDRFAMLMTTSAVGAAGKVRSKLGYQLLDHWMLWVRFLSARGARAYVERIWERHGPQSRIGTLAGGLLARLAPLTTRYAHVVAGRRSRVGVQRFTSLDGLTAELDAFWERNKGEFGITVWRSSSYLQWRVFDNPYFDNVIYAAQECDKLVGYAVVQPEKGQGRDSRAVSIADIVAERGDPALTSSILRAVLVDLVTRGIDEVRVATLRTSPRLGSALTRAGFVKLQVPSLMGLRARGRRAVGGDPVVIRQRLAGLERARNPASWYFTSLFNEGVAW